MTRTVLIVDDHAGFRASARRLLEVDGFQVIGEADSGASGLEAAGVLAPDLVLLDVQLPDSDGIEVCDRLRMRGEAPITVRA
jgi:DNA-binding NarL/FixJ family response regulator